MHAQVADDLVSSMLRALGDPVRLRLLRELPAEDAAEVPVGELARSLAVSDTVVSQHLRVLTGLGLVGHRRSGRAVYHYVKAEALVAVRRTLAHELPRMFAAESSLSRLSARNQLVGKVVELRVGDVAAAVFKAHDVIVQK